MSKSAALTEKQAELLEAMRNGVTCIYMEYAGRFNPNAYYFRSDNMNRCTAQVEVLIRRGLVEKFDVKRFGGHRVRAVAVNDGGKA